MPNISTFLWFDTQAEEAAKFYVSIFPNSKILSVSRYGESGPGPQGSVMVVDFELDGQHVIALNGGPAFKFTEAISLMIHCGSQEEVDYYWDKLTEGGEPSACGWLKDKFGLSWQVTPDALMEFISGSNPAKSQAAMKAMMEMSKLDIETLRRAYESR